MDNQVESNVATSPKVVVPRRRRNRAGGENGNGREIELAEVITRSMELAKKEVCDQLVRRVLEAESEGKRVLTVPQILEILNKEANKR